MFPSACHTMLGRLIEHHKGVCLPIMPARPFAWLPIIFVVSTLTPTNNQHLWFWEADSTFINIHLFAIKEHQPANLRRPGLAKYFNCHFWRVFPPKFEPINDKHLEFYLLHTIDFRGFLRINDNKRFRFKSNLL